MPEEGVRVRPAALHGFFPRRFLFCCRRFYCPMSARNFRFLYPVFDGCLR
ncbi:hypothetical protein M5D96_002982, partial [Drosophila gunungcola]